MVLTGSDGIIFVADSDAGRYNDNMESFQNLAENLTINSLNINEIPLVLQYNKRDLPNVMSVDAMDKKLNIRSAPYFESIAVEGKGVLESFIGILKCMIQYFGEKYQFAKDKSDVLKMAEQVENNLLEHVQKGEVGKRQKFQRSTTQVAIPQVQAKTAVATPDPSEKQKQEEWLKPPWEIS
jgi:50S ribosomal subunit-associated GTPase HflX